VLAAVLAAAGCGGSGAKEQILSGNGYSFRAPAGWAVERGVQTIAATRGERTISVTVFRLMHPFRAELWPRVVSELDGVAANLADQLRGTAGAGTTVTVAGRTARRYDISFRRSGGAFVERITFVLDGTREYQLLCRYRAGAERDRPEVDACAALGSSFRLR
jgi:hypothetical protein